MHDQVILRKKHAKEITLASEKVGTDSLKKATFYHYEETTIQFAWIIVWIFEKKKIIALKKKKVVKHAHMGEARGKERSAHGVLTVFRRDQVILWVHFEGRMGFLSQLHGATSHRCHQFVRVLFYRLCWAMKTQFLFLLLFG